MKIKIHIKNIFTGNIIFELEKENNTFKDTVEEAVKNKISLRSADLRYANLQSADLRSADLRYANMQSADLQYANMQSANLQSADLQYANMQSADLRYANMQSANLRSAENILLSIAQTRICNDGDIIGWKKCKEGIIVKLLIPADAKRNNAFGRKCRAGFAKVLEIFGAEIAYSQYDSNFTYKVGEIVKPIEPYCEDFTKECESGIHFFITREEAEKY